MPSSLCHFITAFVIPAALVAQSEWLAVAQGGTRPMPRSEHVFVGDTVRGHCVMFGGRGATGAVLGDTWIWTGSAWRQVVTSPAPVARRGATATFDAARGAVVVFGGEDAGGALLDDLWSFDGAAWTRLAQGSGPRPSARIGAALASGTTDGRLLLFGGFDSATGRLADTWTWDGGQWLRRSPLRSPSARFGHEMAGDPSRGRVVLYGGLPNGLPDADTWEWDGSEWWRRSAASFPGLRNGHAMAFDSARARVVLHGGSSGQAFALADTFEWDGSTWASPDNGDPPPAVVHGAIAFCGSLDRLVRFGGHGSIGPVDLAFSHGARAPARAEAFGGGCAGSAGVPRLTAKTYERPWLGDRFTQVLDRVPTSAPTVFQIGFSRTSWAGSALPLSLDFVGLTGCRLLVSIDAMGIVFAQGGVARLTMVVPTEPTLVGARLYGQALVVDPAANLAGVTISNGLDLQLGKR
ncbi:MAG: kelch repeat-containing protein [Planctomycetota bacterium]